MGTFLTDHISLVRRWINVVNTSRVTDADITAWVRMAEERFNAELRTAQMMSIRQLLFAQNSAQLPSDFNQIEYVRNTATGLPYEYVSSDEYWRRIANSPGTYATLGNQPGLVPYPVDPLSARTGPIAQLFTVIGNLLYLCPNVDAVNGTPVEMAYVANVPPLTNDADNWLHAANPRLYLFGTLALSAPFLDEDTRAAMWEGETTSRIGILNQQYKTSKLGGGPLRPRRRSFG